jgi:hypothetical protein
VSRERGLALAGRASRQNSATAGMEAACNMQAAPYTVLDQSALAQWDKSLGYARFQSRVRPISVQLPAYCWCMPAACSSCLGLGPGSGPAQSSLVREVNFHGSAGRSEQLHAVGYTHATATCTTSWHKQLHTATPVQAGCVQPPIPPACTSPAAPIKGVCT